MFGYATDDVFPDDEEFGFLPNHSRTNNGNRNPATQNGMNNNNNHNHNDEEDDEEIEFEDLGAPNSTIQRHT